MEIRLTNITKSFGSKQVIAPTTLTVESGSFTTLLGSSGCGKTTLLRMIAGFTSPTKGEIYIENQPITSVPPYKRPVNTVFQKYALFPHLNVFNNVAYGLKLKTVEDPAAKKGTRKLIKKEIAEKVNRALNLVGLADYGHRDVNSLSGGQQQRVALARIMAYEPDVILLDEPFSALDMFLKDQLQREMVNMLEDYEGTVIMVSHDRDEIYRFSEELLIMGQGKIVAAGPTKEVFRNPENKTAARLTGCKNFSRIRKLGEETVEAVDWNLVLHVERTVPEDAEYMGYRAHDFIPVWGERGENMLKFDPVSSASLPFEQNYYIRSGEKADADEVICWFVQRDELQQLKEKGKPDYLKIEEEKILFLRR